MEKDVDVENVRRTFVGQFVEVLHYRVGSGFVD